MALETIPLLSSELIAKLDEEFPEATPRIEMTDRQIWVAVGRREVIRFLLALQHNDDEESD